MHSPSSTIIYSAWTRYNCARIRSILPSNYPRDLSSFRHFSFIGWILAVTWNYSQFSHIRWCYTALPLKLSTFRLQNWLSGIQCCMIKDFSNWVSEDKNHYLQTHHKLHSPDKLFIIFDIIFDSVINFKSRNCAVTKTVSSIFAWLNSSFSITAAEILTLSFSPL